MDSNRWPGVYGNLAPWQAVAVLGYLVFDIIYIMRSKQARLSGVRNPSQSARNRAVTGSRFRTARAVCCLSVPEAAKLLRVTERTIQYWEAGTVRVPYAAFKLMRILRGYELPGAAWKGYRLQGDTLWSPEGLRFSAADHRWWSLTCRMAGEFRAIMAARLGLAPRSRYEVVSRSWRAPAHPASAGPPTPPPAGVFSPPSPLDQVVTPLPAGVFSCASASPLSPSSNHGVKISGEFVQKRRVSGKAPQRPSVASKVPMRGHRRAAPGTRPPAGAPVVVGGEA